MNQTKAQLEIKYLELVANWSKGFQVSLKHALTPAQYESIETARLSDNFDLELHGKGLALEILGYLNRV